MIAARLPTLSEQANSTRNPNLIITIETL